MTNISDSVKRYIALFEVLRTSARVRQFDIPGETEAERLAHALVDMSKSFSKILSELLPDLEKAKDQQLIDERIDEIREEIRHILYHIADAHIFADLVEQIRERTSDR